MTHIYAGNGIKFASLTSWKSLLDVLMRYEVKINIGKTKPLNCYDHKTPVSHVSTGPFNCSDISAFALNFALNFVLVFLRLIYYCGPRFHGRSAETWWQRGDLFRGVSSSPQGVPAHREPNPANPISSHICTHTKICLGARTYVLYPRESDLACTES